MERSRNPERDGIAKTIIRFLLDRKVAVRVRELKQIVGEVDTRSICAFLDQYPGTFERYDDGRGRCVKLVTNLTLCETHCSKKTCRGELPYCSGLHICKFYILSTCRFGGRCSFGHDLTTSHNRQLLHQHLLDNAAMLDIRFLLTNTSSSDRSEVLIPRICKFFNVQNGCQRKNCANLHVCKHYIMGECKFGVKCLRSHDLTNPGVLSILEKHGIDTKRPPKEVIAELREMMSKDKEDSGSLGSSQAERLGQLNIHDDPDDFMDGGHITYRRGARTQSTSNIPAQVQGGRPKTAAAARTQPTGNVPAQNQGARPKTTAGNNRVQQQMTRAMSASVPNLQQAISVEKDMDQWICSYHLCGKCMYKDRCFNAHHRLPYQWMYRKGVGGPWKVFGAGNHNQELEITFCDPDNANCYLDFGDGQIWDIDFKRMKAKSGKYDVKRLSTKSSSEDERNPLATNWKWYWRDQMGNWKEYGEADRGYQSTILSGDIEQEYLARPGGQMMFATQGHQYVLDFNEMVQRNIQYKTRRDVVRRPEFVDEQTFVQRQRQTNQKRPTKGADTKGFDQIEAPPTWIAIEGDLADHCQIVPVNRKRSTREYSEIEKLFFESMPNTFSITAIERVENGDLWSSYVSKRRKMQKRNPSKVVSELQLFHGTSSEYCQAICRQGFDFRLSGTSTGTMYGKGSYFAKTAKYSDAYAKSTDRLIFVVRVLVGEYTKGDKKYVRPPSKDPRNPCSDLYDSCVDNVSDPKIFVIFDNSGQVYPEYVIKYTNTL